MATRRGLGRKTQRLKTRFQVYAACQIWFGQLETWENWHSMWRNFKIKVNKSLSQDALFLKEI